MVKSRGKKKKIKYCRCVFCVFSFPLFRRLQLTLNLDPIYIIRGQNKSHPLTSAQAVSNSEVAMRAVGRRACPSLEKNNLELVLVDKWFLDHIRLKKILFMSAEHSSEEYRTAFSSFSGGKKCLVSGSSVQFLDACSLFLIFDFSVGFICPAYLTTSLLQCAKWLSPSNSYFSFHSFHFSLALFLCPTTSFTEKLAPGSFFQGSQWTVNS